ncbi:TrmH family RNA methyltransferase [bacterium]|nr:TrmH family RNA methyltransferase [bacterium]
MNGPESLEIRNLDRAVSIEEYSRLPRLPVTVILDRLRSSFNVGAVFRTCECARVERLITTGITCHPPDEKVVRTAMGTAEFVPHRHFQDTREAILFARECGLPVYALETTSHSESIYRVSFPRPVCLVFGNEALGLERDTLSLANRIVEIPLLGYKNSLNVSVAAGITLFEVLRQWGEVGEPPVLGVPM